MRDFSFIGQSANFFTKKKANLDKRKVELFELEYLTELKELTAKRSLGRVEKKKLRQKLKKIYRIK